MTLSMTQAMPSREENAHPRDSSAQRRMRRPRRQRTSPKAVRGQCVLLWLSTLFGSAIFRVPRRAFGEIAHVVAKGPR
eukprot:1429493-Prymnesium_polylepis.1